MLLPKLYISASSLCFNPSSHLGGFTPRWVCHNRLWCSHPQISAAGGFFVEISVACCVDVDFPAPYMWSSLLDQRTRPGGPASWMGTLIEEMRDAGGLMYRRNRFYDPAT